MENWLIDKTIEFNYGHRVYTQKLDSEFSLDELCKCRHWHGHQAKVQIFLESNTLEAGMVTDFKHLNWAKKFFDDYIDHKTVIDINDPLFDKRLWCGREYLKDVLVPGTTMKAGMNADMQKLWTEKVVEKFTSEWEDLESYFAVDFIPTSENLSKWAALMLREKMKKLGIVVSRVDWWESPRSRSSYICEAGARLA